LTFLVVIPAHNEAGRVSKVIQAVKEKHLAVLVVDDGSNDGTAEVARNAGASAVSLSPNRGKGAAMREGFKWFLSNSFDALVLMDADGQHDARDLEAFIRQIESGADFVVGSRMSDTSKMPFIRRATNRTMSFVLSSIAKQLNDEVKGARNKEKMFEYLMQFKNNFVQLETEIAG
jgi:glycosyltransferase involved in cell wall biosynthesis